MSKRPRRPGRSRRPLQPGPKPSPALAVPLPRQQLIAVLAAIMAREAARTGAGEADPDAELLQQCAIVNPANLQPDTIDPNVWERALLRASSLRAFTLPGLRAKFEIALMVVGVHPEPGEDGEQFDRMVLWLMLTDVLELIDSAQA